MDSGSLRSRVRGNRLCLDFVNLAYVPGEPRAQTGQTGSWSELIEFMTEKRIVSEEKSEELRALPDSDSRAAETLLSQAVRIGEGMRNAFGAMLKNQRV